MRQSLVALYFQWQFVEHPKAVVRGVKNVLVFNLEYFSVVLLLRTLFAPWKRQQWKREGEFSIGGSLEALSSNLISRGLGAIIRIVIIAAGLVVEAVLLIVGFIIIVGWYLLPLLSIITLIYGIGILI